MLRFRPLLYLVKLNWAEHSPLQWNECVKHILILDWSSVEIVNKQMSVLSATSGPQGGPYNNIKFVLTSQLWGVFCQFIVSSIFVPKSLQCYM